MSIPIRVMVVEDDPMAMRHLEYLVKSNSKYKLIYTIESASMAEVYCAGGNLDLILMDIVTAMHASGLETAIKIKRAYPHIKIVILTSQLDADLIRRAREGNIDSFGYKLLSDADLLSLLERTMQGEQVYPEDTIKVPIGNTENTAFSEQQENVLRELCGAKTDEEIAEALHLSVYTVRKYIQQMLEMTGFHNRTQLAVEAQKLGIVTFGY